MVLIDVDMPESCYYCPFASGGWKKDKGAWCDAGGFQLPAGRNADGGKCPVKSVDGLIDRWQMKSKLYGSANSNNYLVSMDDVREVIKEYARGIYERET